MSDEDKFFEDLDRMLDLITTMAMEHNRRPEAVIHALGWRQRQLAPDVWVRDPNLPF